MMYKFRIRVGTQQWSDWQQLRKAEAPIEQLFVLKAVSSVTVQCNDGTAIQYAKDILTQGEKEGA